MRALLEGIVGERARAVVLGKPAVCLHAARPSLPDLGGHRRAAQEFEVLRVQTVAELLVLALRRPLVRHGVRPDGCRVRGIQDQRARVLARVFHGGQANGGMPVVAGRVGDDSTVAATR